MKYYFLLLNASVAVTLFALGVVAILHNRKHVLNRLFLALSVCTGIWVVSCYVSNDTGNPPEVSLIGNYFVFFFSYFTSFTLLWLSILITKDTRAHKTFRSFAIPLALAGLISPTPLVVAGVEPQGSVYAVEFGPLAFVYGIALIVMLGAVLAILRAGVRRTEGRERGQVSTVYYSMVFAIPVLVVTQFIVPVTTGMFEVTDVGIIAMVAPVIGLYYAVIRHGLLDVKLAAVRSLAYTFSIGVLAGIYYVMAYALSVILLQGDTTTAVSISPLNILLALVLAFVFQPIKRFFDRTTNSIFYRDSYNPEKFYASFGELLTSTTDLRGLLERAAGEVVTTLKVEQGFFVLDYANGVSHHMSAGTRHHSRIPMYDMRLLDEYTNTHTDRVFLTESLPEHGHVRRMLVSHKVALVMPLRRASGVIGYLLLGEHLRGTYTRRDLNVLATISNELVIAIQNALSLHEVREVNAHLQQRIDVATKELRSSNAQLRHIDEVKNEFVSMASHQLRTPLTSVKGYISMVIEGDAGDITQQQKHLLTEAFNSSERMVRLIADFLNVSRLQTGKFIIEMGMSDMTNVVRQEVDALKLIAKTHDLSLKYHPPKGKLPLMVMDEAKVRQVIMNFIDNAIYYSRKGSSITITLDSRDDEVELRVTDTGIGVPKDEQGQLFNKFFRAKNARKQRPDGTGVGLFLAKKVITAHGGSMIFHSTENVGSTFGFRMPIKTELPPVKD